jgi:hypothetical protein
MDFKSLLKPVSFNPRRSPADDAPRPLLRQDHGNRRLAALKEANQVLEILPEPGQSLHCIISGRFDLADVISTILSRLGPAKEMTVATLSFSKKNVNTIAQWIESKTVQKMTFLSSLFHREHNADLYKALHEILVSPHALASSRNHCKICCLDLENGTKLAMESSANLRTNSNWENATLYNCPMLHDYHCAWIQNEVRKHAGNET